MQIFKDYFPNIIQISQKFIPQEPIDNKSSLVHVMAWQQTG